jgi:small subunit ribosomal protein S4
LLQLREKQKARRIYGVLERQFNRYFEKASQQKGLTGLNLLTILERRLDNVVYRLGLAESRPQARQLVQHGHILVNGRKTNIPSALVAPGDKITVRPESSKREYFKALRQDFDTRRVPNWLAVDVNGMTGTMMHLPTRDDIDVSLNEQLIVEYYSR